MMPDNVNPKGFIDDVQAALAEVALPEGDPMRFYIAALRASTRDVSSVWDNVIRARSPIADMRRWLVRVAAAAFRAWLYSHAWKPGAPADQDLISTDEAIAIFQKTCGFGTRQFIHKLIKKRELKVMEQRRLKGTGRPQNFFLRQAVYEAANRRAER